MSFFVTIVLDGVGIGEQPDAGAYGDQGSNTLGHVCALAHPPLPHLTRLGLGCIAPLEGVPSVPAPLASFGKMQEVAAGKDSTTGHWELAGLTLEVPFPTYPQGFPPALIDAFLAQTGCAGILGNQVASGTAILDALGTAHQQTGWPIVYTSADSVFQVAAHVETLPLEQLYWLCQIARDAVCVGPHAVGRVIARPFEGSPGAWRRLSAARRDYALPPPRTALPQALQQQGIRTVSVGKIYDLFAGSGFDETHKTKSNAEGLAQTLRLMRTPPATPTFLWVNLVDFDQEYGHRNDVPGFAHALAAFDAAVPDLLAALPADGRLVLTADHGNDPATPSTDHSREYVPLLVYDHTPGRNLGLRTTFADHAATVAAFFNVPFDSGGTAF